MEYAPAFIRIHCILFLVILALMLIGYYLPDSFYVWPLSGYIIVRIWIFAAIFEYQCKNCGNMYSLRALDKLQSEMKKEYFTF